MIPINFFHLNTPLVVVAHGCHLPKRAAQWITCILGFTAIHKRVLCHDLQLSVHKSTHPELNIRLEISPSYPPQHADGCYPLLITLRNVTVGLLPSRECVLYYLLWSVLKKVLTVLQGGHVPDLPTANTQNTVSAFLLQTTPACCDRHYIS